MSQGARDYQEDACGHWFDERKERLFAVWRMVREGTAEARRRHKLRWYRLPRAGGKIRMPGTLRNSSRHGCWKRMER